MKNNFSIFNKKVKKLKKKLKKNYFGHTSKTFGDIQVDFYKKRLENVRLTWCQQILEIIKKLKYSNPKINDLGCNYFQFYKEIKINKYVCDYFGYDIDKKFDYNIYNKLPEYSGIFISNGPGNPEKSTVLIEFIKNILFKNIPIFGICYGHQILGLASGFKVIKMKYGNRGHNIPAKLMIPEVDRCLITSQNHGYCLQDDTCPNSWKILFTNKNDNSNEGIYNTEYPLFSVQFHPEARIFHPNLLHKHIYL